MSIPADLAKLTDEEVWVDLHHGMIDSPMHRQVILTLQPNNLDRQTRASRELVYAADKLVSATARFADFTRGLRHATWVLVGLTLLLFLATAPQAYVAFRGFR
jgi:hypothetical protein